CDALGLLLGTRSVVGAGSVLALIDDEGLRRAALRGRRRAVSPTGCRGSGDRGPGGCPGVTRGKWRLGPSGRPAGVLTAWGAVGIEGLRLTGVRHLSSKGSCLETEVSPNVGGSTLRPRGSFHRRIGET